ncbi:MAG: protein-export chaperone SecB [Holosporales bacterium]|jgi:preprotein translocase subunit SecB|nr:protein-export chaperone SecB [Holosporales bacterium]
MTENKESGQDTAAHGMSSPFFINDQYIKDLSFENPNFLMKYQEDREQPQVSVNVETNVSKIQDTHYEVSMKVDVKSFVGDTNIFVLELVYGALVTVDTQLSNDVLEPILLVHCPFLMFPFVRNVISEISQNGGYPPLLIEPIDFASLYIEKKQKESATTIVAPDGSIVKN